MAKRWTEKQEAQKYKQLRKLYVAENKSIGEIATILRIGQSTVYDRLLRLNIKPARFKKPGFNNKRKDLLIPKTYSKKLSEFIGILLGDGHLTPTQVTVTLGSKETDYVHYVAKIIQYIFKIRPKIIQSNLGHHVVYFGSTETIQWLLSMGLVFNKVKSQVNLPSWILSNKDYIKGFLRGFFDTDGSIYKLRFGLQLEFTNRSLPLLKSLRHSLSLLGYNPSNISFFRTYLTRRKDIVGFFNSIKPANIKHQTRFRMFINA